MNGTFRFANLLCLLVSLSALLLSPGQPVTAQAPTPTLTPTPISKPGLTTTALPTEKPRQIWSFPELLFTSQGTMHTPLVISDRTGRVHLLWRVMETTDDPQQSTQHILYYMQLYQGKWSQPVDVAVSSTIQNPSATVDSKGILHVIWSGPARLMHYTQVPVEKATQVRNWEAPQQLASMNYSGHILTGESDTLHIAYPGTDNSGVYYMASRDGGRNWSVPVNISTTANLNTSAEYVRMAISPEGTLHVVWTEFQLPSGWPPTGIYYAQSKDAGTTWSQPILIEGLNYDQPNIVAISENELHIVFNASISIKGRYHSWSKDGGKTWTPKDVLTLEGGTEGAPQALVDTRGRLHVLTTYNHSPYYTYWNGTGWSTPLSLLDQLSMLTTLNWSEYFEEPAMTMSEGNLLHAVFWDDRKRLFYSHTTLTDISGVSTQPFYIPPTPSPRPTKPLPSATPTSQEMDVPNSTSPTSPGNDPLSSLAIDLLPSVLVIAVVAGISWLRMRRG